MNHVEQNYLPSLRGVNLRRFLEGRETFIELLTQEGFILLGQYTGAVIKVELMCPEGHKFDSSTPHSFKSSKTRCPVCAHNNVENAKESFISLVKNEGYRLLEDYIKAGDKVKMICLDGHEIKMSPHGFKNGNRCLVCSGKSKEVAENKFYTLAKQKGYIVIDKYINTKTKLKSICPNGHNIELNPASFVSGLRCIVCANLCPVTAEKELYEIAKSRGDLIIGEYVNSSTPIKIQFGECGHTNTPTPTNYKRNVKSNGGCVDCSNKQQESKLATFTKELARDLFDKTINEYRIFRNPKTNFYLPFDLFIEDINTIIEIHGQQHYVIAKSGLYSNKKQFEYLQWKDSQKKNFCLENGYTYIEIDIREHNEETVSELLHKLK